MRSDGVELFFPRFCLGCGYTGIYICPSCEGRMKKATIPQCFYCNKPSLLGLTHPSCRHKEGLDGHIFIYFYNGLFKKILLESKYKGAFEVLKTLLSFSHPHVRVQLNEWVELFNPHIESIPLHPLRMRERGFNQSEYIKEAYFKKDQSVSITARTINTKHLAHIGDKNKRRAHIRNAFTYIGGDIPNNTILVDDVVTSGATILECTKTLKRLGVQTVLAFSLAKG